jgi:hypothetical protein
MKMSSRLKLNSLHPRHPRSASSKASIRKSRVRKLGRQLGCTCGKRKAGLYYEVRKPANKCWKPSNRSLKFLAANPPPSQAPAAPTRTPPVCPKPGPTPPDRLITAPRSRNPSSYSSFPCATRTRASGWRPSPARPASSGAT